MPRGFSLIINDPSDPAGDVGVTFRLTAVWITHTISEIRSGAYLETRMKDKKPLQLLAIDYPILQAGMPWVSNPELVAAVSGSGGLGILHPSAGMASDDNLVDNLRQK